MKVSTLLKILEEKESLQVRVEDKQTARSFPITWVRIGIEEGKRCFYLCFDSESVG